jgi:spermidine/putrescine-binding protein
MTINNRSQTLWQAKFSRRSFLRTVAAGGAGVLSSQFLAGCVVPTPPPAMPEPQGPAGKELTGPLNVVAWDGYDNPEVVKLFEERYGVKLNVKIASGNNIQMDQLRAGAERYDVANPDNDWVELFAEAGLIQPLNRDDFTHMDEMFGPFKHFEPHHVEGKMYGVPMRWGINGIVHWPDKLSVEDAQDAWVMWEERFKDSISIMDWFDLYIALIAQYMGSKEPWTTTGDELAEVTQKLIEIKPNIRSLAADMGTVIQDLANRDAAIAWGSSSNDTSIGLRMDGHEVVLTIPKQGGAIFTEALVIAKDTPHYATAVAYLDFMTSPEVQAMMAWNDTFKIAVCNSRVAEYLSAEQFEILSLDKAEDWVSNSILSRAPENLDAWVEAWEQFKAA